MTRGAKSIRRGKAIHFFGTECKHQTTNNADDDTD
jgi:hypothetical protein